MNTDSTIGFHDEVGFRAGTCYDYPVFDIIRRKQLALREQPLILMEGALIDRLKADPAQFLEIAGELKSQVQQYSGTYTILWHNSTFFLHQYDLYQEALTNL